LDIVEHSTVNGIAVGYGTTEVGWPAAAFDTADTRYELWAEPSGEDALRHVVDALTGAVQHERS
jgi:hypothetical protein